MARLSRNLLKKNDYKLKYQVRLTLQVTQKTNRIAFLQLLEKHFGCGSIRIRGEVGDWVVVEARHLKRILTLIKPYLVLKYEQAELVLEILERLSVLGGDVNKFLEIAQLVDKVALLNDGNTRTHTAESVANTLRELGYMN
jgi:hypothetical protein